MLIMFSKCGTVVGIPIKSFQTMPTYVCDEVEKELPLFSYVDMDGQDWFKPLANYDKIYVDGVLVWECLRHIN
ncbi:MAG: hypothetical protein ACRC5M_00225 [Anaeroplasmataceae bacterium]